MAQHVEADAFHVLRRHVAAAAQEGARLGREREGDGRARARAPADEAGHLQLVGGGLARGEDDVHDVVLHAVVHVDAVHQLAGADDLVGVHDGLHVQLRRARAHEVEDLPLLDFARVGDVELQHEAVELRLGQRVGAFLFERVLRREHEERVGQLEGLIADGHLPLLHRLEQRALHFCGRAVDFVGEDEVAENGALLRGEHTLARVVNKRADEIRREQIGRELDAPEARLDRRGERLHREGLRKAGHAFEQDVPIREQADEQAVHEIFLPDDDAPDLLLDRGDPLAVFLDAVGDFLGAGHVLRGVRAERKGRFV